MRTITLTLGGTDWHLPVSFAASLEIGEKIRLPDGSPADPLTISIRTVSSGGLLPLNGIQVIRVLYVGMKHAGCSWPEAKVGDLVFGDLGMPGAMRACGDYLAAFCSAASTATEAGPDEGKQ